MDDTLDFRQRPAALSQRHILGCVVIWLPSPGHGGGRPAGALPECAARRLRGGLAFLLAGGSTVATLADVAIGLALIALSLPRGTRSEEHYGGWDRADRLTDAPQDAVQSAHLRKHHDE